MAKQIAKVPKEKVDPVVEAQKFIDAKKAENSKKCIEEMNEILKKYDCVQHAVFSFDSRIGKPDVRLIIVSK